MHTLTPPSQLAEGRRRWVATGAATTIPLVLVAVANTVRLGIVDHLWTVAIVLNVLILGSVPFLLRGLRNHDLKDRPRRRRGRSSLAAAVCELVSSASLGSELSARGEGPVPSADGLVVVGSCSTATA